jgi:hypothetical protein
MAAEERWWPSISHIRCSSTYVCHDIFGPLVCFLAGKAKGDRRWYCSGWIDGRCRVQALDLMAEAINREGRETEDRIPASSQPSVRLFTPLHLAVFQGDRCCDWSEHIGGGVAGIFGHATPK